MTEKEMKAKITQAHIDGYNRGYAKAEEKIADIKANSDFAIEGKDIKIMELKDHLAEEVELHLHAEEYIKSLEQENNKLLDVINNQDVKIADLEKQIEKMKCCGNCKHSRTEYEHCRTDKHEKWELRS